MVSFPLKMHIFPTPSIQSQIWKKFFFKYIAQILRAKSIDTGLIIRVKSFLLTPNA